MNTDNRSSSVKKYAVRLAVIALIAAVLAFAYFSAEDIPLAPKSDNATATTTAANTVAEAQTTTTEQNVKTELTTTSDDPPEQTVSAATTAPASAVTSLSETTAESPHTTVSTTASAAPPPAAKTCSFSISCAAAVASPEKLSPGVIDILPRDGIILPRSDIPLQEGDTVYDVLARVCKQNGIQIETNKVAATDSVYIEGIANLYEFDAGSLSGWMFSVDGQFPKTSCSAYKLSGGEKVEILYSCDLGADVGDNYN